MSKKNSTPFNFNWSNLTNLGSDFPVLPDLHTIDPSTAPSDFPVLPDDLPCNYRYTPDYDVENLFDKYMNNPLNVPIDNIVNEATNMSDKHNKIINTQPHEFVMKAADQLLKDYSEPTVLYKIDTVISRVSRMNAAADKVSKTLNMVVKVIPFIGKVLKIARFIANACVAFECTKSPVKAFTAAFKLKKDDFLVELFEEGLKKLKERLKQEKERAMSHEECVEASKLAQKAVEIANKELKKKSRKETLGDKAVKAVTKKTRIEKQPRDRKGRFLPFK